MASNLITDMKYLLLCIFLCVLFDPLIAQIPQRNIRFRSFDKDSVNLTLNQDYYLIEDSCAQIIRYGHFNFSQKRFFGRFKDVSKLDTTLVVSEGAYTDNGLKNGQFISRYLNGKLQSKGDFKDNKYDGKWETYYDSGNPQLTFEVTDGTIHIIDAWKPDGTKSVDNGNGVYMAEMGGLYWKGKLINGQPDGTWNLLRNDDITNIPVITEHFKKGQFRDGSLDNNINYTNMSRITLVSPFKLQFVNAERMLISPENCNGPKRKHIVNAQYIGGLRNFSEAIKDVVSSYFARVDLKGIDNTISIEGNIAEDGTIIDLKNKNSFREDIAHSVILRLVRLPLLHPATVDGKPVKQKFTINFIIRDGFYQFNYSFLPIQVN